MILPFRFLINAIHHCLAAVMAAVAAAHLVSSTHASKSRAITDGPQGKGWRAQWLWLAAARAGAQKLILALRVSMVQGRQERGQSRLCVLGLLRSLAGAHAFGSCP